MLLEFKVANYRSIGEEQVLSLIPAPKQKDYEQNILVKGKYKALNAIALYGANASGKSNMLKALSLFDKIIHVSARASSTAKLPFEPFLLRKDWRSKNRPTSFEIMFVTEGQRYRYGFEFDAATIRKEWLFRKVDGREVSLFEREDDTIDVSSGFRGNKKLVETVVDATRSNALFLSTCDMLNVDEAKQVMKWFRYFNMIDGLNPEREEVTTLELWQKSEFREKIRQYLSSVDHNVVDIDVKTKSFEESDLSSEMPDELRKILIGQLQGSQGFSVSAKHKVYGADMQPTGDMESWSLDEGESAGGQRSFQFSGPILWALSNGGTLIIDEIEAKLHPIMTLSTIELFLNPQSNPNYAQLIFATHDTNLLTYSSLRRDQIYFAEKNKWESTELYSLSDFVYFGEKNEKERPDSNKEKRYIEGRYGAIPALTVFQQFMRNIQWQNVEK